MFETRVRRFLWLLLAAGAWVSPAASADSSTEAVESLRAYAAYKSGDYDAAYALWLPLAEAGNATAMLNLANMHEQGQGRDVDLRKALDWTRRAAEAGDSRGQLYLGLAYEKGRGIERDNRLAAEWFRRAAEQGDPDAQFNLGVMLMTGYGAGPEQVSTAEREEARGWLEKAAEQNHAEAKSFLKLLP